MTNESAGVAAAEAQGQMIGYFLGALLMAFLLSRLGLYLRKSSRYEASTVAGVHLICFLILALVSCSSTSRGASGLGALFAQLTVFLIDYFRLPDPEDYHDDEPQKPRAIRPLGYAAIGGALLLGLASTFLSTGPVSDETLAADVERGMASTEGGRLYLESIKRNFPDEHRDMVAAAVQFARQNQAKGFTPEVQRQAEQMAIARMEALLAKYRPALVSSPAAPLNVLARASRDFVLQARREAPEICAAYALGAPTVDQMRSMPESMRLPAARMTVAMLDASRAGLDKPVKRDVSKPPPSIERVLDMVRRDIGSDLAGSIGDSSAMARRSVRDKCRIAAAFYTAMADLPPEDSATITAYNYGP